MERLNFVIQKQIVEKSQHQSKLGTGQAWFTSVKDIIENDYILSANTYNPYSGEEEIKHREPEKILREIKKIESDLRRSLKKLSKF